MLFTTKTTDLARQIEEDRKTLLHTLSESYPEVDELLLYSLERRHLDTPSITELYQRTDTAADANPVSYFSDNVRLMLLDEISYDADEEIHLPGVESVLSGMRNLGHSLIFVVQGEHDHTRVYAGVARFMPNAAEPNLAIATLEASLKAHFPGSRFTLLHAKSDDGRSTRDVSDAIRHSQHLGVLTGIPSLKREEERGIFVQGLERLIRALRGKNYTWLSIADPIPQPVTQAALDAARDLQSQIHHLVKSQMSKAFSSGTTAQVGLFGMKGSGNTEGISEMVGGSHTETETKSKTQNLLEGYQRIGSGVSALTGLVGPLVGKVFGTALAAPLGPLAPLGGVVGAMLGKTLADIPGKIINDVGAAITGKSGHSETQGTSVSDTQSWATTTSQSRSQQLAGGGFGSLGFSWTRTTTVTSELLNRKLEYAEEVLQKYEERLREGYALGMWNLGHYFCTEDEQTYRQGCGVLNSMFAGMDNQFEPPRTISMARECCQALRFFSNIYFTYGEGRVLLMDKIRKGEQAFRNHPLGIIFNGPATPVNTRELAIALPFATQDIEGVTVSRRASFGINLNEAANRGESLTLGCVLDKGGPLPTRYRLKLKDLTKHLAIFGLTGSGKTNTMHHLLAQLWNKHRIPFMVIEPAKSEYRSLSRLPELKDDLLVISAGVDQASACPLRLNPFDFTPGNNCDTNRVHVLTHIDRLKSTFNSSFPMYASMPYILEEAILEVYRERGWDLGRSVNRYVDIYREDFSAYLPTLHDLMLKVDSIVQGKGYYQEQQMNIQAALRARLSSLMVGAKGSMFNCRRSISAEDLWTRPVVIELDNMGDDDEKAFLMGLLVSKLYEYRKASFGVSASSGAAPRHVLVIEEAHRLLANVPQSAQSMETANVKAKAVSSFIDMLSEIRALGESVMIVDQLPSRVSPNIVKGTGAKIIHRLLAKDDREAVGHTMGLTDKQVEDLCLLRTGECVVNQDGDNKSFMCLVPENENHSGAPGGDLSGATQRFKQEHADLLAAPEDLAGKEDERVSLPIHIAMMAIACGQPASDLPRMLQQLDADKDRAAAQFAYYWKTISQSIWNEHQGDYKDFVRMQEQGARLFDEPNAHEKAYRAAAKAYFNTPRNVAFSKSPVYAGLVFEHLLLKTLVYQYLSRYSSNEHLPEGDRLLVAMKRALPLIDILPGVPLERSVLTGIVAHILKAMGSLAKAEDIVKQL